MKSPVPFQGIVRRGGGGGGQAKTNIFGKITVKIEAVKVFQEAQDGFNNFNYWEANEN